MAMPRHARFHCSSGWSAQKTPMLVCSGVRVLPVARPKLLTSLYSRAQRLLVSLGGPGARNCSGLSSVQGRTVANCGVWG